MGRLPQHRLSCMGGGLWRHLAWHAVFQQCSPTACAHWCRFSRCQRYATGTGPGKWHDRRVQVGYSTKSKL